jgi:ribosomal protein L37AE/L43A
MDNLDRAPRVGSASVKPLHLCPNCTAYVIAAIWSERVSDRCVRNLWSCEACGCEFETSAYIAVKPATN